MTQRTSDSFPDVQIHPSAYVDEPCEIGAGTKIWHFCHVMKDCRIGRHCNLGQNVVVSPDVTIGDNVKVQNNVSIYTGVVLEDDVFCGPSMVFTNVVNPRSEVVRRGEYLRTTVRRGATLGANSTVVCGIEIGRFAFVAAGAVVTRDVEPYALMAGVPARRIGWACRCGTSLPRATDDSALTCAACGNEYRGDDGGLRPVREVQDDDALVSPRAGN
ncbi:MAG: acyltransferase [Planctomycetota bacterium]|jgi:UDP-2-acetamido-3-amino-2,3-dideoxy-glucuronate N-acetyltransferase